jgi:hypothetical protein
MIVVYFDHPKFRFFFNYKVNGVFLFFRFCGCLKMQGGRGNRDPFFDNGDPFGGFGGQRSLLSDIFGGRDPFDDPFFTRPFGGMLESNFFGSGGNPFVNMHPAPFPNMLPSPFPNMHPSPFPNLHPSGFADHQAPELKKSRGPIIEELDSDNEKGEGDREKKENPRKHGRSSKEPYVEDPDDEAEGETSSRILFSGTWYLIYFAVDNC